MTRIEQLRLAFKEDRVYHVYFNSDGSGVEIEWKDPTGYHGTPCRMSSSFNTEDAIAILSGRNLNIK